MKPVRFISFRTNYFLFCCAVHVLNLRADDDRQKENAVVVCLHFTCTTERRLFMCVCVCAVLYTMHRTNHAANSQATCWKNRIQNPEIKYRNDNNNKLMLKLGLHATCNNIFIDITEKEEIFFVFCLSAYTPFSAADTICASIYT